MDDELSINKIIDKMLKLYKKDWNEVKTTEDYIIYDRKIIDNKIKMYRIDILIERNCDEIYHYLESELNDKKEGDLVFRYKIEKIKKKAKHFILLVSMKLPFPLKKRDFNIIIAKKKIDEEKSVIVVKSIKDDEYSEKFNIVRGKIKICGYLCSKVDDKRTIISYIIHIDPRGIIPANIVNRELKKNVIDLQRLKTKLEN